MNSNPERVSFVKTCKYGIICKTSGCNFNHPNRSLCRFKSSCTRADCWYNHEFNMKAMPPQSEEEIANFICKYGQQCKSTTTCTFNHPNRGNCRDGDFCSRQDCWYNHRVLLCKFGKKCSNGECQFRHSFSSFSEANSLNASFNSFDERQEEEVMNGWVPDVTMVESGSSGRTPRKNKFLTEREVLNRGESLLINLPGNSLTGTQARMKSQASSRPPPSTRESILGNPRQTSLEQPLLLPGPAIPSLKSQPLSTPLSPSLLGPYPGTLPTKIGHILITENRPKSLIPKPDKYISDYGKAKQNENSSSSRSTRKPSKQTQNSIVASKDGQNFEVAALIKTNPQKKNVEISTKASSNENQNDSKSFNKDHRNRRRNNKRRAPTLTTLTTSTSPSTSPSARPSVSKHSKDERKILQTRQSATDINKEETANPKLDNPSSKCAANFM